MYPILVSFPGAGISISSYGAMMSLGFLAAFFLTRKNLPRYGIDPRIAPAILVLTVFGGILGAKLYYATDMTFREGHSWIGYFRRPGGLTWYGGLGGGVLAAWAGARLYGARFSDLLDASAFAVPIGQALGRLGCFLVGDDYGIASNVPWAMAFPNGSPPTLDRVHPTQLYELAWLIAVAAILARRRDSSPRLFAEFLVANGLGRFLIEFIRLNPITGLGLSEPQTIALGMMIGGGLWWRASHQAARIQSALASCSPTSLPSIGCTSEIPRDSV